MNQQTQTALIRQINKWEPSINKASLNQLSETAWILSYTALWNTMVFSETETETSKSFIYNHFNSSSDPYRSYIAYSERVLLARAYVNKYSGRYIPLPSLWFSETNAKGFAGTKKWHDQLVLIRSSLPLYKLELKALAEAVLEMNEEASLSNYRYWKSYFIEKNAMDLLSLFMAIVANSQCH